MELGWIGIGVQILIVLITVKLCCFIISLWKSKLDPISVSYATAAAKADIKVTVFLEILGDVPFEKIKERILEGTILAKKNGNWLYPQFRQIVTKRFGFFFWKWDKNYDAANHFELIEEKRLLTPTCLNKLLGKITTDTKFNSWEKSPWKFVIVKYTLDENPNSGISDRTGIFLLFDHGLADGLSMYKAIMKSADFSEPLVEPSTKPPSPGILESFKIFLKFLINIRRKSKTNDETEEKFQFTSSEENINESTGTIFVSSPVAISINKIKTIKNKLNVSFVSVCLSVLGSGMQTLIADTNGKPPMKMDCTTAWPKSWNDDRLGNSLNGTRITIPIAEKNHVKRTKDCHKMLSEQWTKGSLGVSGKLFELFFSLPEWMQFSIFLRKLSGAEVAPPVGFSNLPGPTLEARAFGNPITNAYYTISGKLPVLFFHVCSYNNRIKFTLCGNEMIFSSYKMAQNAIEQMSKCIEDMYEEVTAGESER